MTKEEYEDFALRYKGCGACFPMYHTLSRFEKMWFDAIQKDVADLEKENAELKTDYEVLSCSVGDFGELQDKLEKEQRKNNGLSDNFIKAKEILKKYHNECPSKYSFEDIDDMAEQFLNDIKEIEK